MKLTKALLCALGALLSCLTSASGQTPSWTQLSLTGGPPPARFGHTAVLNPANGRMMVFGGIFNVGGSPLGNDVWILQDVRTNGGNAWQVLTASGTPPSARGYHSAIYDQVNNRMIVFGGDPHVGSCAVDLNDVWVLTNADGTGGTASWTQLSPSGGPPGIRSSAGAAYDSTSNRLIIFGGNVQCGTFYSDVWVLSNANGLGGTPAWMQLSPTGGGPGPRTGSATAYDPASNRLIVFGGSSAAGSTNDTWILSNPNGLGGAPSWTQLNPTGPLPAPRSSFSSGYDPDLNLLVVFGGLTAQGYTNDAWVLSNANGTGGPLVWTQLNPAGSPPGVRSQLASVLVPLASRMVICGGVFNSSSIYNDAWALQYAAPALAGAWHFSEGSGTTTADAAGSHPGTLVNSPAWVAGISDTALNFNGNNYVVLNSSGPILGAAANFTVEAWVKPDGSSSYGRWEVYCEGTSMDMNLELYLQSNFGTYNPSFTTGGMSGQSVASPTALSLNAPHHLAAVFQAGQGGTLYVDGQPAATNPYMSAPAATTTETDLARASANGGGRYFGGVIDEVQVFRTARSAAQIMADYLKFGSTPSADLAVTQTAAPNPVALGANVTFNLSVTNQGPDTASDVVLTDYLMPELNVTSVTVSQGNYNNALSLLTWNIGSLAGHASATAVVSATVYLSSPGLGNTCTVGSSTADPAPANNTSTITLATSGPPPGFIGISLSGTNLVINATNGAAGSTYTLLGTTNLLLPSDQWTPVATNVLTLSGTFTMTNSVSPNAPYQFYILRAR